MDLPWFKLYARDWLSDRNLRRCSHAAQGVWLAMLCLMNDCNQRGYLIDDDSPWNDDDIAAAIGGDKASALACILELCAKGVASRDNRGAFYSRRMVRDEIKRRKCSEAGKRGGGNPQLASPKRGTPNGTYIRDAKGGAKGRNKGPPKGPSGIWVLISQLLPLEFRESAEFRNAWAEWEKYRKSKGKPISEGAARKQAKKIAEEFGNVQRAIAAIEHSIGNDYQGLYAPPDSGQRGKAGGSPHRANPVRLRAEAGKYDGI